VQKHTRFNRPSRTCTSHIHKLNNIRKKRTHYTLTATAKIPTDRFVKVIEAVGSWSEQWQRSVEWKCLVPSCKRTILIKEDAGAINVVLVSTNISHCRKVVVKKTRLQHKVFSVIQLLENPTAEHSNIMQIIPQRYEGRSKSFATSYLS